MKNGRMFESKKFTSEMLENELWDVLNLVRAKKIKTQEANSVIFAAKEICAISRLRLQYRFLEENTLSRGHTVRSTGKVLSSQ